MHRVLESLRGLPVRAVVTLGPALAGETFDVPGNVQVEPFVPHEVVLPYVSAVVTQCGLSTVTKVLAAGLPMVCLPVLGDQPANAARITSRRCGCPSLEGRVGGRHRRCPATSPRRLAVPARGATLRRGARWRGPEAIDRRGARTARRPTGRIGVASRPVRCDSVPRRQPAAATMMAASSLGRLSMHMCPASSSTTSATPIAAIAASCCCSGSV